MSVEKKIVHTTIWITNCRHVSLTLNCWSLPLCLGAYGVKSESSVPFGLRGLMKGIAYPRYRIRSGKHDCPHSGKRYSSAHWTLGHACLIRSLYWNRRKNFRPIRFFLPEHKQITFYHISRF